MKILQSLMRGLVKLYRDTTTQNLPAPPPPTLLPFPQPKTPSRAINYDRYQNKIDMCRPIGF